MAFMELIFDILNIARQPNLGDTIGAISVFLLIFVSCLNFISKVPSSKQPKVSVTEIDEVEAITPAQEPVKKAVKKISWSERLLKGLSISRNEVWNKIGGILSGDKLSSDDIDTIEELLYSADMSPQIVEELLDSLKADFSGGDFDDAKFKQYIHDFISKIMSPVQEKVDSNLYEFSGKSEGTKVIMVVGVNGAGKTTTIGKLATKLKNSGATVLVGACDTFRAAAVEQLEVWANRAGVEIVKAAHGADPSGVAYDALAKARSIKADYCILDTAGRLHTNSNLMDELAKTKRVLGKLDNTAPHETLLVVDAITGQNAMRQAEEFNKALSLTGLIFTKCDGSAKAGSAVGIVKNLQVPIAYIGVGEDVEDLNKFDLNEYLNALVGTV